MIDRIAFTLGEALAGIRRNVGMSLISVTTAAIGLFLIGGIFLITRKLEEGAQNLTGRFEMVAFMKEEVDRADVNTTIAAIRAIPGVGKAVWIPRDKRWEQDRAKFGFTKSDELPNPYPESFKVVLSDLKRSDAVAAEIRKLPKIDEKKGVSYKRDEQIVLERVQRIVNWTGGALGTIFLVVSGVLVFNTTRLAIASRRSEIRIMRLIGAHWFTVDVPFLVEGIVFGAMGGVLATGALSLAYSIVAGQFTGLFAGGSAAPFQYIPTMQTLSLVGAAFGLLCAALAIWIPERGPRR